MIGGHHSSLYIAMALIIFAAKWDRLFEGSTHKPTRYKPKHSLESVFRLTKSNYMLLAKLCR